MRCAYYESTGSARDVLRLADLPDPLPGPGEVRVRVQWSGVNPSDVKSRGGVRSPVMPFPRVIPHSDGMGVIDRVGEGVNAQRVGEPVWLWNAAWGRPSGTAAQFCCLPQRQAVRLPEGVIAEAGACMGIPGLTALHAVAMDGGVTGKTILIAGGAGAVGHYAIQFANRMGAARIITTVSGEAKERLARDAGADEVINYKTEPLVERVRELTHGSGVDRIIEMDIAVNGAQDLEMLRTGGDVVAYGSSPQPLNLPFATLLAKNIQLRFFMVYHLSDSDRATAQGALQHYLSKGDLIHNIADRLPLERIVEAHEAVEAGKLMGNLVLSI